MISVGVLGATGILGQHFLSLLQNHPWFKVTFLGGSRALPYEKAVHERWHLPGTIPSGLFVSPLSSIEEACEKCDFIFSALPGDLAAEYEEKYARAGLPVLSNASYNRKESDIPVLIAEVNKSHLEAIASQKKRRGFTTGFIVTKPNCAIQSFMLPLAPLHQLFGLKELHITTLQAISGAGLAGLPSLTIQDNVIPYIAGEEEKVESEPLKIFGHVQDGIIAPAANIRIAAHCNRVPVLDGHMACLSVSFQKKPTREAVLEAWARFSPLALPSAPQRPILYRDDEARPQSRLDRDAENGMSAVVGRLRPCPLLDFRFVGLSHNAIRGGAGGAILNAELLVSEGYIGGQA